MIADVREQMERAPFRPFVIRTSDGHEYSVPTVDHVFIAPRGNQVIVVTDEEATAVLGPIHISSVIDQPSGE
jgi:hypothetical protein